tara:strand:+ start:5916 stop:6278 length:363 start_codon:yes stop_codon:yes gene_type:complete
MGFQKTVLIIALVILTIAIIFIATIISKNESNKIWPPETGTCPPYYTVSTENNEVKCKRDPNAPRIGESVDSCNMLNLKQGETMISDKAKCEWSNACKIQWDGISSPDCNVRSALPNIVA